MTAQGRVSRLYGLLIVTCLMLVIPAITTRHAYAGDHAAWQSGTWDKYKQAFIMPEGRVVDNANGGISHSEGQGYGMLLAVYANDEQTFQQLFSWTKRNLMVRSDGLASWKWEPDKKPNVTDPNNASDGDLLIAWALAEAYELWGKPEYAKEAAKIALAVDRNNGARSPFGRILLPGASGFSATDRDDGPVVNLSYWIFPAFEKLRIIAPTIDWDGYKASGLTLLKGARFNETALPPDWLSIAKGKLRPADGFPPQFSYNAVRIPLYLAWGAPGLKEYIRPFSAFWQATGGNIYTTDVVSGVRSDPFWDSGYRIIFALTDCAVNGTEIPYGLRSVSYERYYPATLQMLSLVASRQRYGQCW